jgi:CRISPR/Cas system-associated exonuclease Cas4 (RecB family)
MKYLSKSDFKVAQTCSTKLFYKKHKYPSLKDTNDYLSLLADGGFMIGKLAQLLYPEGKEIIEGRNKQQMAIEQTEKLLEENENITLFEPIISVNNQLVRIDILEKRANHFNLIEVKSKSYNSKELQSSKIGNDNKKSYWLGAEFLPYLEDVAFQKKVVLEKFPDATVNAFLLMPDKSKKNMHKKLIKWFVISKKDNNTIVEFTGTTNDAAKIRASNFMGLECVDKEIDSIKNEIAEKSEIYIKSLLDNKKIITPISFKCKNCEYRTDSELSGFSECWGKLADPSPHILELGQLGNVNRRKGYNNIINNLISEGKVSLNDVPIEAVLGEDKPYQNDRPFFQLTQNKEFLLAEFIEATENIEYPLHFIDFETCQMAVPFHADMRPFQNVIFQWSCHTLHSNGTIEHFEWLNTKDYFPNIEFAKSLKKCIGITGTVMAWSPYENSQLNAVLETLEEIPDFEPELKKWLKAIIVDKTSDDNRILDMHTLALKYYFHPKMGGRTSIKVVLPSVLLSSKSNKIIDWLKQENLFEDSQDLGITDPYELLEKKIIDETSGLLVQVKNGGDAMIAYREMMYGLSRNNKELKNYYNSALKKYCKLDTLAMLIIWEHWQDLLKSNSILTSREQLISDFEKNK